LALRAAVGCGYGRGLVPALAVLALLALLALLAVLVVTTRLVLAVWVMASVRRVLAVVSGLLLVLGRSAIGGLAVLAWWLVLARCRAAAVLT
jgi:hypothetical protein